MPRFCFVCFSCLLKCIMYYIYMTYDAAQCQYGISYGMYVPVLPVQALTPSVCANGYSTVLYNYRA